MKLKHLFLASVAVCAFAACSDDNNNGIDIPDSQEIETYLSLSASPAGDLKSKATETEVGSANESFINELTAYVFYEDGSFAATGTTTAKDASSVDRIENVIVKVKASAAGELSTTKFKVILLANVKLSANPVNLDALKEASFVDVCKYAFSKVHSTPREYVPMFSQIIEIGGGNDEANMIKAGKDHVNWIVAGSTLSHDTDYAPKEGDQIALTRHMARVQLEALNCDFTNNYLNANFTLTDVYVANVSNSSKLYAPVTPAFGLQNVDNNYNIKDFVHGCTYNRGDYILAEGASGKDELSKSYGKESGILINKGTHSNVTDSWYLFADATTTTTVEKLKQAMAQFYVFEFNRVNMKADANPTATTPSGDVNTMLILKGEWSNNGITDTRYYRVPIKEGNEIGVKRNNIYKVWATLTGEGSKDPDSEELNACLSFSVKVEPWTVIRQTEEDEN